MSKCDSLNPQREPPRQDEQYIHICYPIIQLYAKCRGENGFAKSEEQVSDPWQHSTTGNFGTTKGKLLEMSGIGKGQQTFLSDTMHLLNPDVSSGVSGKQRKDPCSDYYSEMLSCKESMPNLRGRVDTWKPPPNHELCNLLNKRLMKCLQSKGSTTMCVTEIGDVNSNRCRESAFARQELPERHQYLGSTIDATSMPTERNHGNIII